MEIPAVTDVKDLLKALRKIRELKDDVSKKFFASLLAHAFNILFEFFESSIDKLLEDEVIARWVSEYCKKHGITKEDIDKMRRRDLITFIYKVLDEYSDQIDFNISLRKAPKGVKVLIKAIRGVVRRLLKDKSSDEIWSKINEYFDKYVDSKYLRNRMEYYRKVCPRLMRKAFDWFIGTSKRIPFQK